MDGELVTDSSPNSPEGSGRRYRSPSSSYAETFQRLFPFYLAIGMTATQYWDDDPSLTIAYRKAD